MKTITELQNALSKKKPIKNQNQWLLDAVEKSKESKKQVEQYENIYVLYVVELENSYFYVGRTTRDIETRLKEHLQESKKGKTKKCVAIRQILAGGCTVGTKLLSREALSIASMSEEKWIWDLESSGIQLVNSKSGDSENYVPIIDNDAPEIVWKIKDIEDAKWERGHGGKKVEWYAKINNTDVYRIGWCRMRFLFGVHEFKVAGMSKYICFQNLINHFTKGHESHTRMVDWMNDH